MESEEGKDIVVRVVAAISFVVSVLVGVGCVSQKSNRPIQFAADEEIYVVQPNDSIKKIANANGVTIPMLKAKNGLAKDGLRVGQKLKVPKKKFTLEDVLVKAKSDPLKPPFALPTEEERPIAPLPKEYLVGKWRAHWKAYRKVWWVSWNSIESSDKEIPEIETIYEFKNDGTFSCEMKGNGKVKSFAGKWRLNGETLALTPDNSIKERHLILFSERHLIWFSANMMTLRLSLENQRKDRMNRVGNRCKKAYGDDCYINEEDSIDRFGVLHSFFSASSANKIGGEYVEHLEFPEYYERISAQKELPKASYEIVSCERETGNDFTYCFVLNLTGKKDMQAFRAVQQEFRAAIKDDYAESFPGVNKRFLFVEFPEYKLNNGKIEGRAVVLTISVTSFNYDPNTRAGKLAVKVNANQYEEARKWIRKNIETLARDKNIALTTGEIPPAAKFYLGREELKDGNILEIEFKTE